MIRIIELESVYDGYFSRYRGLNVFWAVQCSLGIFHIFKKSSKMTQFLFFVGELELFSRIVKVSGQYEAPFPRYTSLKSFEYMAKVLNWIPGFSRRKKNNRKSPIFSASLTEFVRFSRNMKLSSHLEALVLRNMTQKIFGAQNSFLISP